ncbi:contractile injection system tape measure protein [Bacteroides sp.]|uniref:contractile injection system tape measure protein n=1 Tax=Bacteroides sp. TaxID=29523 RepID=UPI0025B8F55E|nr:contractile injection system tape measure protein [Bacteroides sp.]
MIRIDHISLEFAAADERFVHDLYADWDGFCRNCFEKTVDECFSPLDKDRVLHEIELLELDLGGIPEEDFYREFPRRLKAELLKVLPSWGIPTESERKKTDASRLENLLFYLEHGYQKVEWDDSAFGLTEELDWAVSQQALHAESIASLCMKKNHALRRLLWQTSDDKALIRLYTDLLSMSSFGLHEKRRFLAILLEMKPGIPVRFIHEDTDDNRLQGMAELLDTLSVRRIMETETEEHAEVDLPPYWHYLYEWLINYYPFNGIAIFGGKGDFICHLHHRLLTFIRKRNYSFYLSKQELTVNFLLEVFGTDYYRDVLNAIYDLQPHYADGSPVYDGYLNRELYRIFLQLSLLRLPMAGESPKEKLDSGWKQTAYPTDMEMVAEYLNDTQKSIADKRSLFRLLTKEKPEILTDWLQSEAAKDNALFSVIANMVDTDLLNRLLSSVSFMAMEVVDQVRTYLLNHISKTEYLKGISETQFNFIFCKAVLLWIENEHCGLSESERIEQLLHQFYQEISSGSNESSNKILSEKLYLSEDVWKQDAGNGKIRVDILKLRQILADKSIPELVKRRMTALFLEQSIENEENAIWLLHEHEVLEYTLTLISEPVLEEIIRQSVLRMNGISHITELLSLFDWLVTNEQALSAYLKDRTFGLKVQMVLWLAKVSQSSIKMEGTAREILYLLLMALFGKENIPVVIKQIFQGSIRETETGNEEYDDMEAVLDLLMTIEAGNGNPAKVRFEEWVRQTKKDSDVLPILLENRWSAGNGFTDWLEDATISTDGKRELLQRMVVEKVHEWVGLLRRQPEESKAVMFVATYLSAPLLLQSVAQADFRQAAVLSETIEWLQCKADGIPFLTGNDRLLSTALSEALLFFMQDRDTLGGRSLTEKEVVKKFLAHLYFVYTGKTDFQSDAEWTNLPVNLAVDLEMEVWQDVREDEFADVLLQKNISNTIFSHHIVSVLEKYPEKFLAWLEKDADLVLIKRIVDVSDITILGQLSLFLSAIAGFEYPDDFRRLTGWLSRFANDRIFTSDITRVLLLWVRETNWKKQTPEQMEDYFISRLFGKNVARLPIEWIADNTLPESVRKRMLYNHIFFRPKELLDYIRQSVVRNTLHTDKWLEWMNTGEWLRLVASLSLSQAELLQQVMDYILISYPVQKEHLETALATYIIENPSEEWAYNSREEKIRSFVKSLPILQEKTENELKNIVNMISEKLMPEEEKNWLIGEPMSDPKIFFIDNAGLCLLSAWFLRLLSMLDYLNEARKDIKDTKSRIRAIFLLQYLTYQEEKEYRETELVFNRLLVGLPMHIPLPKRLELTAEEKQIADSLLSAVKAHWPKMNGTSMKGFLQSFVTRTGRLEEQDEKWVLTVDDKAFDILLDSVPWGFRQIRLPWLKKYIQVKWHEK